MAKLLHEDEYNALIADRERLAAVLSQLPEGMQHCTIQFKECERGHGWLTATNWVQHPCQQCLIGALIADRERLEWMAYNAVSFSITPGDKGDAHMVTWMGNDGLEQVIAPTLREAIDRARGAP